MLLVMLAVSVSVNFVSADILYVTGRGTLVRGSVNSGVTWANFENLSGAEFRGIAVDENYVFVVNLRVEQSGSSNVQLRA
ncbi:MAG: hypothetical protein N2595_02150 [bacterium]|nr:hypothetical protein [bacterium]